MANRLSRPLEQLREHYDVVVIGSGYGGGVAASRLSRAGRSVCLLERGEERQPGEYPDTLTEAAEQMQADTAEGTIGSRTGLYNFHLNRDINVLVGCGLGGTSLINANVSLPPDPRVFDDPRWPTAIRDDLAGGVAAGVERAREMLRPQEYPADWPALAKLEAQERAAAALGQPVRRTPINVTFEDGVNHVGVEQKKCTNCGDCVSGCNYGAKNTTLMNYLPDAANHGTEIFCGARVQHVEKQNGRWLVWFEPMDAFRRRFDAPLLSVAADMVVLAAGTLGSTEILLRSKAHGLPLSSQVGERFSGNGDVLAFAYDTADPINGIGSGHKDPASLPPVGPCITTVIDLRPADVNDGMIVEEGSIPGALGPLLGPTFAAFSARGAASGRLSQLVTRAKLQIESMLHGAHAGSLAHTQTFLVMSHDEARGRMTLEHDRLRITWPGVGEEKAIVSANAELAAVAKALGGVFVRNPIWSELMGHEVVSVHPLGGCVMGESADTGVVNHKSQVFAGSSGREVHDGLYVCDGAVVPLALGVNPLLTISALAERSMALAAAERGWTIDYALPSKPLGIGAPPKTGLQFTEKMAGAFSTLVATDYESAAARGKADGSTCAFVLTIVSEDLETMLDDPTHPASIYGTVVAPQISPDPMTVTDGTFNLFVDNPDQAAERNMRYRMTLRTTDGRTLYFDGHKTIEPGSLLRIWPATTTLYTTIHDGDSDQAPVLGRGILRIKATDFAVQMTTMEVRNAPSTKAKFEGLARFGKLFAGVLWETYGGVASALFDHDDPPPPRKKRPLQAPAPEIHMFKADDGVELRLVRFKGGSKGPIVCAPGFSNSTLAFTLDTVEPNFAEFFAAHEYDTWLFDYRASPALPASRTQFTLDDIARRDWPAAIRTVREVTGAADVQIVGHCVGSLSTYMALLSGLTGVRQFVSSQLTPHIDVEAMDKFKAGIHLIETLKALGMPGVTTGNATTPMLRHVDHLLALYPMPAEWRALGGVSRRIYAIYGHVLKPENLNQATVDALGDIFGFGNLTAFSQITELLRKGHLVDANGNDTYLPQVGRLKLPIAIIHGADNVFFFPKGSERTYEWLRAANGTELYSRHVIPGYAHLDCFIGANAARDVLPVVLAELEKGN
ncbi:MAG TPA: GMC oxidoreductase [Vicinamibacterales bacterium]|nr:GMC oxidoreductase [Vicinamibacterales bacterium]